MEQSKETKPKSKKWLWIGGGLFSLFVLSRLNDGSKEPESSTSTTIVTEAKPIKSIPLAQQIKNEVISAKEFKSTSKYSDYSTMLVQMAIFKAWAIKIREAESGKDPDAKKQAKTLKQLTAKIQTKEFPKMRSAYIRILKEKLWENDIKVDKAGSSTIRFTGGVFAANKNIKEFHTNLYDQIAPLRFRQAQYKWYSGDDEFTYYDLKSPKDSELMED